jgi:hypothetical protein
MYVGAVQFEDNDPIKCKMNAENYLSKLLCSIHVPYTHYHLFSDIYDLITPLIEFIREGKQGINFDGLSGKYEDTKFLVTIAEAENPIISEETGEDLQEAKELVKNNPIVFKFDDDKKHFRLRKPNSIEKRKWLIWNLRFFHFQCPELINSVQYRTIKGHIKKSQIDIFFNFLKNRNFDIEILKEEYRNYCESKFIMEVSQKMNLPSGTQLYQISNKDHESPKNE